MCTVVTEYNKRKVDTGASVVIITQPNDFVRFILKYFIAIESAHS